jgi:hypothetical protein
MQLKQLIEKDLKDIKWYKMHSRKEAMEILHLIW